MTEADDQAIKPGRQVTKVILFFGAVTLVLLLVFRAAEQRGESTLLPRYCDAPESHLSLVKKIILDKEPAGDQPRRPYIIAAKLLYLIPRQDDEPVDEYIDRLRRRILGAC